jgi:hypothetical protein
MGEEPEPFLHAEERPGHDIWAAASNEDWSSRSTFLNRKERNMRLLTLTGLVCFYSIAAMAQDSQRVQTDPVESTAVNQVAQNTNTPGQQQTQHPVATTYSNGYEVRLKIHKYASIATLPLFATEFALGQSLYDNPERGSRRTAHGIIGAGIVGLFAANTVTGGWNLWESRHDPNGRKLRILHTALMLAAGGGFVAAAGTAPNDQHGSASVLSGKARHRDIAVVSIGVGTAGYLIMLFKGK